MYRWYVINTYSGHENKVKHNLEHRVQTMSQNRNVRQVVVPTEQVSEMKDGQKVQTEKRTMPGYVLVNMEMTDDAWGLVKNTPGVTGFVGSRNKPVPLSKPEVDRLLHRETAERPAHPGAVLDRRIGQSHLRPAFRLLRRDRRDQRGRGETQGPGLDLRSRDPGRGRLRPSQEDLGRQDRYPPQPLMAKKVLTLIKLQIQAGNANPAPPVGPALGQHGVNIMDFCKAFNAQTQTEGGTIIPVEITVYEDRSFTFITKTPPAAVLIKEAIRIPKGSGEPHVNKVGTISQDQIRAIAERKMPDLNANDIDAASKIIAGTARSMGVDVK